MKQTLLARCLALPLLLVLSSAAWGQNYPTQHGCGGFCFKFLGGLHQHGPLFNYGPYSGYYPFEPYGPWNSQLQYSGPGLNGATCGWNGLGCGHGGAGCGLPGGCGLGHARLGHGGLGCGGCGAGACLPGGSGFGPGQVFRGGWFGGLGDGAGLRELFQGGLRFGRERQACDVCATAPLESPLGLLRKVFHRCHPGCEAAKISTGCSAAPACSSPCPESVSPSPASCGGCGVAAVPATAVLTVSGMVDPQADVRYRKER